MKALNLERLKFGYLTVLQRNPDKSPRSYWDCICYCGNTTTVSGRHLTSGNTKSCGCMRYNGVSHMKHGGKNHPLYATWCMMKQRCSNPKNISYPHYGGRGISVCEEWEKDFSAFLNWAIANGWAQGLSLDRIDNNKGYSPENCRWATQKEQCNNKRNNIKASFAGTTKTLTEWAESIGVSPKTLISAAHRGENPNDVVARFIKGGK